MPIDLRAWEERVAQVEAARVHSYRQAQEWVEQAVVRAEALTGTSEWDYFLSLLQPLLNVSTAVMTHAKDALPSARTDDSARALLVQYWYQKGRVDAFMEASALPKTLKDRAASVGATSPVVSSQPESAAKE